MVSVNSAMTSVVSEQQRTSLLTGRQKNNMKDLNFP